MLAGVCGGIGHYFGVDPVAIRVVAILLVVAGFGVGLLLYLIAWAVIPQEQPGEVVRREPEDRDGPRFVLGIALVGIGFILIVSRLLPWLADRGVLTAVALVALGSVLVAKALRR
jgi:phage shock protein C